MNNHSTNTMSRARLLATLLACIALTVQSPLRANTNLQEQAAQLNANLQEVLELKSFVDANATFCNAFSPGTGPDVQVAIQDWYNTHRIDNLSNIIGHIASSLKGFKNAERERLQNHLTQLETRVRTRATEWCEKFTTDLQSDSMNFGRRFPEKLQSLNDLHATYFAKLRKYNADAVRPAGNLPTVDSPTYQSLIAAGISVSNTPIATEFRCYGERSGADYNVPDFILQLDGKGAYQSTFGAGGYVSVYNDEGKQTRKLNWTGSLGKYGTSRVENSRQTGQKIEFSRLEAGGTRMDYACYQQGAREQAALTAFRLKDPQPGDYECRSSEGGARSSFTINPNFSYTAGGETGRYTVDIRGSDSSTSDVTFISGPLQDTSGDYGERAGTGLRRFSFEKVSSNFLAQSSSSRLDMTCTSLGEVVAYATFGDEEVPPPPAGSGGMSGLFSVRRAMDMENPSDYDFYVFTEEGRVFRGEPDVDINDIQCDRSRPSGRPRCDTYRIEDDKIVINNGIIDQKEVKRSDLVPVPSDVTTLEGRYSGVIGGSSGLCVGFSSCHAWHRESIRTYTRDGRFFEGQSSLSTTTSSVGGGTGYGSGSSNSSTSGQYRVAGNTIHLRYDNGVVDTDFIAVFNESFMHTGGWSYSIDR